MFKKHFTPVLLAAVASLAASAAAAVPAVTGRTSVTDLTMSVADLRPDDGIEAGFTLGRSGSWYLTGYYAQSGPKVDNDVFLSPDDLQFDHQRVTAGPDSLLAEATLEQTGQSAYPHAHTFTWLTLSPFSSFTLSGVAHASLNCVTACDHSSIGASASLRYEGEEVGLVSLYARDLTAGTEFREEREFSFTFDNLSARPVNLLVSLSTSTTLYAGVAPAVPEPATTATLLAGLSVLGALRARGASRRRKGGA
ncbi:PEP-CTERM sorting domain-containing protein [Aquabacterium sp. A7-Y]|uniref:PEP-CTERM sorting domain-containing protein n=1 Tax=Aquabacterium sp. A7-Y TaxID=1349605 RepID=UPI00223CE4DE|nr:PEP-CTERM sorting domain-containing protein [Aquabacterium sp. A7-Y]MCW7537998.1 PEP-CTERM sorting domain-containing protein [Aquabacterium sp. A7-Y]